MIAALRAMSDGNADPLTKFIALVDKPHPANAGLAVAAPDFAVDGAVLAKCLIGIALIGFISLAVSFSLARWVALSARGAGFSRTGMLVSIVFSRPKTDWKQFFRPQAQ